MSAPVQTLTALRETLRAISGNGERRRPVQPFGVAALDSQLADMGLRLDALHEVASESGRWGDDAAATLFVASVAARTCGPVLWVLRS